MPDLTGAVSACGAALLALAAPAAGGQEARADAAARPPDVLLIVVDDLNDWVGHLGGHPGARTPAIDRLAAGGLAFTNAHCVSPVCNPSRTAMLGGVRPDPKVDWEQPLEGVLTLTRHFAEQGYTVAGAGKVFARARDADGFAEHFVARSESPHLRPERPHVELDAAFMMREDKLDWGALELADEQMPDHMVATWVAERLQRADEAPLFLAVGFNTPHLPWYLPASYFELHPLEELHLPEVRDDDRADLPDNALRVALDRRAHDELVERELWAPAVQAYLASIAFADRQIGRVLDALERSPRADRTIVVLTSDHGYHLGEKQHWRKFSLWEEATRVPLVIAVPGSEHAGGRCGRPVDLLSLYPTLCTLAGLPVPEHVEGVDLTPLLEDPEAPWEHAARTSFKGHRALRTERWRYILYADGGEELYDHDVDPGELENLAGLFTHREVQAELRARLLAASDG